jgi:hypothetical protein
MDAEAPTDTVNQTISEATFLLTELRYTLGQIHVQIGDLDAETRRSAMCRDRSVESILQDMMASEDRYQEQYAQLLGVDVSSLHAPDQIVPLPMNEEVSELPQDQDDFEHNRAKTIALLENAGDNWPSGWFGNTLRRIAAIRRISLSVGCNILRAIPGRTWTNRLRHRMALRDSQTLLENRTVPFRSPNKLFGRHPGRDAFSG